MASTGYNYIKDYTVCDGAIKDMRELISFKTLQFGDLSELMDIHFGVIQGEALGFLGEMDEVGRNKPLCNPDWDATNIATDEKKWELGPMVVQEQLCADDFEQTIAKYSMNMGTRRADLTDTDLIRVVIEPALERAIQRAVWRVIWHGMTDAAVAPTGIISASFTADLNLFNMTDGLWKRLFAAVPTGSAHRTTIAANSATTKADQYSQIFQPGVATGIFTDMIRKGSPILRQQAERRIVCTQSLADALSDDILNNNKGSDLQWTSIFDENVFGGSATEARFLGVRIIAVPKLDEMIQVYNDLGATYYLPHRAIYYTKEQLNAGIQDTQLLPDLSIFFDQNTQQTRMIAATKIGTLVLEDDLLSMAY